MAIDLTKRAARPRQERHAGISCETSGRPTRKSAHFIRKNVTRVDVPQRYANVFNGDAHWRKIKIAEGETYRWDANSTYVQQSALFRGHDQDAGAASRTSRARVSWRLFGDKITTDHISPAGSIKAASPAGKYLQRAGRRAGGLQSIRHAARQSRSDDARHLRQYPHQELHPEGCRRQCARRRQHQAFPGRRDDVRSTTPR